MRSFTPSFFCAVRVPGRSGGHTTPILPAVNPARSLARVNPYCDSTHFPKEAGRSLHWPGGAEGLRHLCCVTLSSRQRPHSPRRLGPGCANPFSVWSCRTRRTPSRAARGHSRSRPTAACSCRCGRGARRGRVRPDGGGRGWCLSRPRTLGCPGPSLSALGRGPAPLLDDAVLAPGPGARPGTAARGLPRRLLRRPPATAGAPGCCRSPALQLPPAPGLQQLGAVFALPAEPLPPPPGSPPDTCPSDAAAAIAGARGGKWPPGPVGGWAQALWLLKDESLGAWGSRSHTLWSLETLGAGESHWVSLRLVAGLRGPCGECGWVGRGRAVALSLGAPQGTGNEHWACSGTPWAEL